MQILASGITRNALYSLHIRAMRELIGKHRRFFLLVTLAALALRFFLVWRFPAVVDDSRLYANIAENWMQHGIYAVTNSGRIMPTLSRLPGYPAFLAAIFYVFGIGNFRAVLLVQVLFDIGTCFLIADMARRLLSDRAAKWAFILTAICPFLANYAATALTETLEIFFTALTFDLAIWALTAEFRESRKNRHIWFGCGLSIAGGMLLRPDGGILLMAVGGYLLWLLGQTLRKAKITAPTPRSIVWAGVLVALGATAPLIPWTIRNLHTLHRFQPLAPRYANDSDEPLMPGFNRWVKTWMAEYVSVEDIYWNVPGEEIDFFKLPSRAFDSAQQHDQTRQLFADYNHDYEMSEELDARFAALAAQRIRSAPLRYYFWLPGLRIVDMWLRPRTELFPSDPRWWEFNDNPRWLAVSIAFGIINLIYVGMAVVGLVRVRHTQFLGVLLLFVALRSLFLGTMENPEPRYTLECYPVIIFFAAAAFSWTSERLKTAKASEVGYTTAS
jgi:4-amino-4-deoxy-L-arabinose transferase-like glycosyltransferase